MFLNSNTRGVGVSHTLCKQQDKISVHVKETANEDIHILPMFGKGCWRVLNLFNRCCLLHLMPCLPSSIAGHRFLDFTECFVVASCDQALYQRLHSVCKSGPLISTRCKHPIQSKCVKKVFRFPLGTAFTLSGNISQLLWNRTNSKQKEL